MTVGLRMTVEQYLALPEEKPYREYVCGEVVPKAMPNIDHAELVDAIAEGIRALRRELGGKSGPEVRVRFDTERGPEYRLPDYAYWRPERPVRDGKDQLPPTLAVEVRSPDEAMSDQREKCRYFRRYGVDVCWLIDPESRSVEVFEGARDGEVLTAAAGALGSPLLPGFRLKLADLFAVLDQ
jgi:Uma2 family endonuclease